jgi:hypothetical protein
MVVHDFNVVRTIDLPDEAHAPLIVNADTALALAITLKRLQLVAGWNFQAGQLGDGMQLQQFPSRHSFDILESAYRLTIEERLGLFTCERANHVRLCSASQNLSNGSGAPLFSSLAALNLP